MTHDIKLWPVYFPEVESQRKPFEIRWMDRPYEVGDTLFLREWDPDKEAYTGRSLTRIVTYIAIMDVSNYDGLAVMGLRPA